jgi:hypothetical protein
MALPDAEARRAGMPGSESAITGTSPLDRDERPMITTQTILGIDPGAHGAVAVLGRSGDLLDALDTPSTPEANGRAGGWTQSHEGSGARLMKFTVYEGSRQLTDGESEGKNHVNSIGPESPPHRGHPTVPANKQRGNCRMEERNDSRRRKRSSERRSKH